MVGYKKFARYLSIIPMVISGLIQASEASAATRSGTLSPMSVSMEADASFSVGSSVGVVNTSFSFTHKDGDTYVPPYSVIFGNAKLAYQNVIVSLEFFLNPADRLGVKEIQIFGPDGKQIGAAPISDPFWGSSTFAYPGLVSVGVNNYLGSITIQTSIDQTSGAGMCHAGQECGTGLSPLSPTGGTLLGTYTIKVIHNDGYVGISHFNFINSFSLN